MRLNTFIGFVFLFCGLLAALYFLCHFFAGGTGEFAVEFALACLFAVLGWQEIGSIDQIGERF